MSQIPLKQNPNPILRTSLSPFHRNQKVVDYNHELLFHKVMNGITGFHFLQTNLRDHNLSTDQFPHSTNSSRRMMNQTPQAINMSPNSQNNPPLSPVRYNVFDGDNTKHQNHPSSIISRQMITNIQRSLLEDNHITFPERNRESSPYIYNSLRYQNQDSRAHAHNIDKRRSSPVPSNNCPRENLSVNGLPLPIKSASKNFQPIHINFHRPNDQNSSKAINFRNQTPDQYTSIDRRLLESQNDRRTFSQEPLFDRLDSEPIVVETFSMPETVVQKPKHSKIFDGESAHTKQGRLVQTNLRGSQNPSDLGSKSIDRQFSDVSDLKQSFFFPQDPKNNLSKTMPLPVNFPDAPEKETDFTPNIFQKLRLLEKELFTLKAINYQKTIEMRAMAQKLGNPTTELKTLLDERAQKDIKALTDENLALKQRVQELENTIKLTALAESKKKNASKIADLNAQILILEKKKIEMREKYENFKKIANNGTYEDLERYLNRIRELEDYVKRLKRKNELVDARMGVE